MHIYAYIIYIYNYILCIYYIIYIYICIYMHILYTYIIIYYVCNNKYSWTLCHSISAIDHASFDGAV